MNKLPTEIKSVSRAQCIELFQEIIACNTWGLGVLGSVSKVPATKLHGYLQEIFEAEE